MDKDHYRNLLKDLVLPLLSITYENEKLILNDKRMDVAIEIGNLLFRLNAGQETMYTTEEVEIIKVLTGDKKQKKVVELFNFMISYLVYQLGKVVNDISDQLDTMLIERFEDMTQYMTGAKTPEDIVWQQSLFDEVRKQLKDDVARARYKPSGTKGFGKCGRCNSEELYVNETQTRSCDEPMTVNYLCINCNHKWTR